MDEKESLKTILTFPVRGRSVNVFSDGGVHISSDLDDTFYTLDEILLFVAVYSSIFGRV